MIPISRDLANEQGFDCSQQLSPAECQRLAVAVYRGKPFTFCWRYVAFGPAYQHDINRDELEAITGAGMTLLVVQHPRVPERNVLSSDTGKSDGEWAVRNAVAAGYMTPAGAAPLCLALDLEGVQNPGASVAAHAAQWAAIVNAAGYRATCYVGYDAGLSPQELYLLHGIDRYWSAPGPWNVATRGFCCRQGETVNVAGVELDPDTAFPDQLGGVLTGLAYGIAPSDRATEPDLPQA